ncbi:hypothetical protein FK220_017705 [Flavobacteriaceae bacterium TP-CH-4]|uniref:Uncharacterized protein n=1 Tax=Pelagihabitans pacificus TaxID=2696054 RepID=A0A967AVZ4_9FLAO|nr:hypothetical protein [Pelagihabitans pacificus]NHF61193.1 hypothetical protein [Pelagihabitans pacificus]
MKLAAAFLLVLSISCKGQSKHSPNVFIKGIPTMVGPKIMDSGYPLPIAIFTDSSRQDVHYSGWANYDDVYIADPDDANSPIIIHKEVEDVSFELAANKISKNYGFGHFDIETIKRSPFYQKYNLDIAYGLAKTELNGKAATTIIQGQRLDGNTYLVILTIVQDELFKKWSGMNILLMQMGYIQTFKTLPKEMVEVAVNGSANEKLKYFERVNARAQTAISNQSVEKGKINDEIMRMLSDKAQLDVIQFQWDMSNDILYGNGW